MRRALFGLFVVLILTGCDRSSTTDHVSLPPRYETGADVRDALITSGLGCDDFRPISPVHRDLGAKDAVETDSCRIDNQDAVISIRKGLGQKQDWARQRAAQGCRGTPIDADITRCRKTASCWPVQRGGPCGR